MKTLANKTGLADHLRALEHPNGIIVCEDPKFIYLKATKTAGTSILRGLLEKEVSGIFHGKDHPERFQKWLAEITDEALEDYYVFTVVRNPWDRFVSAATYFKIPFKKFVRDIEEHWQEKSIKIHTLPLSMYTHIEGRQFVDAICRFECLQPDINLVLDSIGLPRKQLAFSNRSKHKHYSSYYSEEEIERVAEIYKDDIKYHGYSFQLESPDDAGLLSKLSRMTKR